MRVYDDERTASLLKRRGIARGTDVDFESAQAMAREANVGTLVLGDIRREGDSLAIEVKVHDVRSGDRLDTRIVRLDAETKKARTIFDTISDNAANAGIVTGGRAVRPDQVDMRWMGAIVSRNAEVEETGLGAGVLNQPARGVAWLANRLAQYGGGIEAGQIVLAGSFIRPIEARHGDTIVADFGPYGTISLHFA